MAGEIRALAPDDPRLAALLELIRRAFAEQAGRVDPPSSADRLTVDDIRRQATPPGTMLVAEIEDRVVGCVFLEARGEALYLGKLAVEPAARGQGHARALMAAAEEHARRRGHARLELESRIELVENHALFRRLGYVETGENAHPGYDRPTSLAFTRDL